MHGYLQVKVHQVNCFASVFSMMLMVFLQAVCTFCMAHVQLQFNAYLFVSLIEEVSILLPNPCTQQLT